MTEQYKIKAFSMNSKYYDYYSGCQIENFEGIFTYNNGLFLKEKNGNITCINADIREY